MNMVLKKENCVYVVNTNVANNVFLFKLTKAIKRFQNIQGSQRAVQYVNIMLLVLSLNMFFTSNIWQGQIGPYGESDSAHRNHFKMPLCTQYGL